MKPHLRSQTRDWKRVLLTWAVRSGPAPGAVGGSRRGRGPRGCWRGTRPAGSWPRFPDSAGSASAAASRLPASTHVARPGPLAESIARLGPATPQVAAGAGGVGAASGPQALPRRRRACSVRTSAESFLGTRHWHLGLGEPAGGLGPSMRGREGGREPSWRGLGEVATLGFPLASPGGSTKSRSVIPAPRKLRRSKCSSVNAYSVLEVSAQARLLQQAFPDTVDGIPSLRRSSRPSSSLSPPPPINELGSFWRRGTIGVQDGKERGWVGNWQLMARGQGQFSHPFRFSST